MYINFTNIQVGLNYYIVGSGPYKEYWAQLITFYYTFFTKFWFSCSKLINLSTE